ncbi:D-alanyl-D-alanine carboxypeptidase (penicillin-binding protein 5/6) [Caldalkalibacillus uzonensis]|uniref:serine-type D-Ala-D-Ala carboxypeptidase n=1 Tax=Caldalkalibacillus uzonensis TaxID=353224 RepID=A0ABU0CSQ3_9BACI|nr:D-alanyl-D-alanine carboxypeptidase family protein [Caldalkalibacillus uzonensis]MDQ0339162.1 D-alanyl-D-alanine carboxypeptidase (penicillin-binding protein 5/6) [Caldalkalibacillus uzonensis]
MKGKVALTLVCLLLVHCLVFNDALIASAEESNVDLAPEAKSAILMDMDTGTVIYEKDADLRLPPASITKIMTMLLVMEAIESGELNWSDKVRTSERAASMGGSQIFLEAGEEMTVEDLMKGIAIASGNDATVAIAEHIAGTEENFVRMMNEKAKQLGLENTHFANTNGLPADHHYTSARDIAIMSRALLKYEDITRLTSLYEDYLRQDTDRPFWLVNTNRLVKFYKGMDGLKTGYTSEAKYCLAATAKRGDMRMIAVVMGTPTPKVRNKNVVQMLDYAFNHYQTHPIYKKGDILDEVTVDKGAQTKMKLVAPYQISVLTRKGESVDQFTTSIQKPEFVSAPVKMGDVLGQVLIEKDGRIESEMDIVATEEMPRATFWQLLKRTSAALFSVTP